MPRTCELDDVFQEALRGLDEAAWRFDGSRGTFKSFARPRVEGQVRDWQRTQDLAWSRLHKRRWAETVPLVSVAEEGFRHERELDIEQRSEPRPDRSQAVAAQGEGMGIAFDALAAHVVVLPLMERVLLGGLYAMADEVGEGSAGLKELKGRIFPGVRRGAGPAAIQRMLESLEKKVDLQGRPLIELFESHGYPRFRVGAFIGTGLVSKTTQPVQQVPGGRRVNVKNDANDARKPGWQTYADRIQARIAAEKAGALTDARATTEEETEGREEGKEAEETARGEGGEATPGTSARAAEEDVCAPCAPGAFPSPSHPTPPLSGPPLDGPPPTARSRAPSETAKTSPPSPSSPPGPGGAGGANQQQQPEAAPSVGALRAELEKGLGTFTAQDERDWLRVGLGINWNNGAVKKFRRLLANAEDVAAMEGRDGGRQYFWGTFKTHFAKEHGHR